MAEYVGKELIKVSFGASPSSPSQTENMAINYLE